ncbi:hypothetical protein QQF64_033976 [Cirrhinus molitorella]|uniref:ribonuclease H n=1 Tax=Cirrhinus molitorella TaxID=172907 RepID=A0ABR3MVE1_9TELE
MRQANTAITTAGYHQLELHLDSRYITTFTTHLGLRRYKRLNFGISSAAEVFQNAIAQTLQGIKGVKNLSDDIIVYGDSQRAHDEALRAVFQRLKDSGLTLNREMCEFNKHRLEFYGFIFSASGISADPKKVTAILQASEPKDPGEIRSLLGMANYCSQFIQDFSTISAPLRELTKKGTSWQWGDVHKQALQQLKDALASATTMSSIPQKTLNSLSMLARDIEKRYSQTEREALAIVWSCEHFHLYLYGHPFALVTDHKPLQLIWNNPRSKPPARIERWGLRLQLYQFRIEYRKGTDNPADFMSRHPISFEKEPNTRASKVAEEYVNFMALQATPKAMTLDEIKSETKKMPLKVTKVKGTMVTAEGHGHSITRNCSFFKRLKQETPDFSFELRIGNETEGAARSPGDILLDITIGLLPTFRWTVQCD